MADNKIQFHRVASDINGNPRYVCHFANLNTAADKALPTNAKYAAAVKRANSIGGRKYDYKTFGGGIVFQSYSLRELMDSINRVTGNGFTDFDR